MNVVPFIPPRTRAELSSPALPRGRHEQALRIAMSLLGQGFNTAAVLAQLRGEYEDDVSDKELNAIIKWAASKNPQPCGYKQNSDQRVAKNFRPVPTLPERVSAQQAIANVREWLGDFRCDECDLWHVSPLRPLEDWHLDALMLFAALYEQNEFITS